MDPVELMDTRAAELVADTPNTLTQGRLLVAAGLASLSTAWTLDDGLPDSARLVRCSCPVQCSRICEHDSETTRGRC
jgi:hypothetical protein